MTDYKKTLLMPNTAFEMKANLSIKEPKIQKKWILDKIEKKILTKNKNKPPFIIADGPPYANGDLHMGHAFNKILKDFILRYKSLSGFYTKFIPGWDTHGLPIEQEMNKKGIGNDKNLTITEKRKMCKKFAIDNVYKQKNQFLRMGLLSEMDHIYLTCDLDYEIDQLKIFNKMLLKGLIYQDLKPVYWSWSSQTALADAEIIYQEVTSHSLYVAIELLEKNALSSKNDKVIIWTTTPYTLPANLAIAAHPKITYAKVKVNQDTFIIAKKLVEHLANKLEWNNYQIIDEFLGKKLENLTYKSPLTNKTCKIIVDNYVSDTDGTGLVHNAPGFGHEDYLACKKYNIKPFCPIDELGKFTSEVKINQISGLFYQDANPIIIKMLTDKNVLLKHELIKHTSAHDWRTKKPVIYRATKQWFVNIEKITKDIVASLNKVKSVDNNIVKKIKEMVLNRQEWCISRQRVWGVPICIIYDKDFKPIINPKLLNNIVSILNNEGIDAWYKNDVKYFLTPDLNSSKKYIKETDIMDVWFDSGTSYSVLIANKLTYPANLYLEGKDQFRGWFNSSLVTSVATNKKSPYLELLTHGFVLDEHGNKMSKSAGNVIDPLKICNEYGADILRIWVASVDFLNDVSISNDIIKQCAELYRKIRNTLFRFTLGNLSDFNLKKLKTAQFSEIDLYVLTCLSNDIKTIKNYYEKYDYKQIIKLISNNVVHLSSWYFDYIKDGLYCEKVDSTIRIAIQATLYYLLDNYLKILAPIIPYTCEEAYEFFNKVDKQKSIHLEDFANFKLNTKHKINLKKWEAFFNLKDLVYSEIEKVRNEKIINTRNQAFITITSTTKLPFSANTLQKLLMVAKVETKTKAKGKINIKVKNAKYTRCERCWNYFEPKLISKDLCKRCLTVLSNKK